MKNGNTLIATPAVIGDLYFHRTVILMVNCSEKSSMGFIINKKLEHSLNEVTNQVKSPFPLYYGGPVETDNLFFIYKSKINISKSLSISKNLSWGGNFDEIIKLINDNEISENDIKFFLGYSGWSKNQLNKEMNNKNWEVLKNIDQNLIFSNDIESVWKNNLNSIGGEYLLWSNTPDNPNHN